MTFKQFANQEVEKVLVKLASSTATWKVGDLFSYVPATGIGAKITKKSEATTALGNGHLIYLVAQSDQITEGLDLAYKTYKTSENVAMSTTAKTVVAYKVKDIANINGYASEE